MNRSWKIIHAASMGLICAALLGSACQSPPSMDGGSAIDPTSEADAQSGETGGSLQSAPVGAVTGAGTFTPGPEPTVDPGASTASGIAPGAPTPTPDVLRLVFPTSGYATPSVWRPPLYEVPWALTDHDHFYFTRPITSDKVNWPLSDYRYGGIFTGTDIIHTGIDIDADYGTPVISAGDGEVVWAGYGLYSGTNNPKDPYGLAITIKHNFSYGGSKLYTVYAHLSEILVSPSQSVKAGEVIGKVGMTGNTTGPHLHFEVRVEDNSYFSTRNPELWIAPPQGWGVLAGRIMDSYGKPLTQHKITVFSQMDDSFWTVSTYGSTAINSDPYYNENLVLSDLPEGNYTVRVGFNGYYFDQTVTIHPGLVTYFTFKGWKFFNFKTPSASSSAPTLPAFP